MILHSKIIGQGEPLIILHGLLGMGDNWVSLAKSFADSGYEVHLIDQRNHGKSFHDEEMNYEVMLDDLEEYLTHHGLSQINLLGHSMGGKTAMFFAVRHPEKVKKMIIVDISPKYYSPHHHFIFEAIRSLPLHINSRKELESYLDQHLQNKPISLFLLKNLQRKKEGGFSWKPNISVLENALNDLGEALPPMSVFPKPVLFIKGEKSPYISSGDTALIRAHFPASKIINIPGAGHWVHAEKPHLFKEAVLNFLK